MVECVDRDRVEVLVKWATEQGLFNDIEIISKLYDEARRRWGHLMTSLRISVLLVETLVYMNGSEGS